MADTALKIRLSETVRQQLMNDVGTKPFNAVIVERLEADFHLSSTQAGGMIEVKIRLPQTLRRRLAAAATSNKRTLTAEIRARLEISCAVEITRWSGREMRELFDELARITAAIAAKVGRYGRL